MKVLFVAINAKYLHTNPAVRLLHRMVESRYESKFIEYTIKEPLENMIHQIVQEQPDVIGCSCYLWNIEVMMKIIPLIRKQLPNTVWIGGGPEVGYDPAPFLSTQGFDYIVGGDGECSIISLLDSIEKQEVCGLKSVANRNRLTLLPDYVEDLSLLPDITDLYTEDDCKHRIIYLETSRGCPFQCSYCLSSVDAAHVRFVSLDRVTTELSKFAGKGAEQIKFLDRTFNVNETRFLTILKFLETLPTKQIFQFEISADLLKQRAMEYLASEVPYQRIRLEIGIQSTNEKSNIAVQRRSNIPELLRKIKELNEGGRVITHVDLIAGLPFESFDRFQLSFNQVFPLFSDELQLGFLKLLRGTSLRRFASTFGYRYDEKPPYEVFESDVVSTKEFLKIKQCENAIEAYWNKPRAQATIRYLWDSGRILDPYLFFEQLGGLIDLEKPKQEWEYYFLLWKKINQDEGVILDILKYDYLRRNKIRPVRFWGKETVKPSIIKDDMVNHSLFQVRDLQNAFVTSTSFGAFIILYQPNPIIYIVKGSSKWTSDKKWSYSCD